MNNWYKKRSDNPMMDLQKIVLIKCETERKKYINGIHPQTLWKWNPLQTLLFWDSIKNDNVILEMFEQGANPNLLSMKGLNFFHLFILLLYYHPMYRNTNVYNILIKYLKLYFKPDNIIIINSKKTYFLLDMLILLQGNKFPIKKSFLSNVFIKKTCLEYEKLPQHIFDEIVLLLLCLGAKTCGKYYHFFLTLNYDNMTNYFYFDFFRHYVLNRFKLPLTITNKEISTRINFMIKYKKFLIELIHTFSDIPVRYKFINTNENYFFNPELIPNNELCIEEFMFPPIEESNYNIYFHSQYFNLLQQTHVNPYNRKNIDQTYLSLWKHNISKFYIFPLFSLTESVSNEPYLFYNVEKNVKASIRYNLLYIEQFFSIFHPYNNILTISNFKSYQLKYIGHLCCYHTTLLPKFQKLIFSPDIQTFIQCVTVYIRKHVKFISMIHFMLEEAITDLKCFEKIKFNIADIDQNSMEFLDLYFDRHEEFNSALITRFIENLLIIERYRKQMEK